MPSTTSSVVSSVFASSTVMTPSLPTFSIASAMILPIVSSPLAEIVPTCAIMLPLTSRFSFLMLSTTTSTAFSMPRFSSIGFAPATTITKDGVTVAKEIDLKDPLENMGAQMVREVASKTSDTAGAGTTTATVLAQAIYREGAKNVVAGANPMELKRGIEKAVEV